MSATIKRFDAPRGTTITEADSGDYVLHADHLAALSAALAKVGELEATVSRFDTDFNRLGIQYVGALSSLGSSRRTRDQLAALLREAEKTIHKLQAEVHTTNRVARYLNAMRAKINAALSTAPTNHPDGAGRGESPCKKTT